MKRSRALVGIACALLALAAGCQSNRVGRECGSGDGGAGTALAEGAIGGLGAILKLMGALAQGCR
jgi:hypothetical protein